jgi:hypothetical protein
MVSEGYLKDRNSATLEWYIPAENCWYMVGENRWYTVAANYWDILGENCWYIIERKMTSA